jgi:hypothetical protein
MASSPVSGEVIHASFGAAGLNLGGVEKLASAGEILLVHEHLVPPSVRQESLRRDVAYAAETSDALRAQKATNNLRLALVWHDRQADGIAHVLNVPGDLPHR